MRIRIMIVAGMLLTSTSVKAEFSQEYMRTQQIGRLLESERINGSNNLRDNQLQNEYHNMQRDNFESNIESVPRVSTPEVSNPFSGRGHSF